METRDIDKVSQIWEAYDTDLVGAAAVKIINGKFDLAWLVVEEGYEDVHLKEELYELVIDYLRDEGASQVFVNTREWEFYNGRGFRDITDSEMPEEFRYCVSCEKRSVSCFPKSMVLHVHS